MGDFSAKIGFYTYFQVELHEIMFTIEYANMKNWRNLWFKSDSMLIIRAYSDLNIDPWHILIKCKNTLHTICSFKFKISHILRERNACVDRFVNASFFLLTMTHGGIHFLFGFESFFRDRLGMLIIILVSFYDLVLTSFHPFCFSFTIQ